ncbi:MAG: glycosyltransferase family 4 protein [Bacteroidales bacterium]|jgi:glycosyltransferase involved in cell wall biosynthesis|nr:glycosyltransferase family 4 protein [Bacteroidales bacterium]
MKKNLIYISPDETSFTKKDIDFLSKKYHVLTKYQPWSDKHKIFINFFRQFIFLLRFMPKSVAIMIMFGGYWSFLPALLGKLFNKPVYIILGGADCVSFPEYQYGSLRKPILRKIIKWSYMLADRLLPVADSLVRSDYEYDPEVKQTRQGFLNFFPDLKTPFSVIYNGFDPGYWKPPAAEKSPLHFTTIAKVSDMTRYKVKGIDLIVSIAPHFPGHFFHIVGLDGKFAHSLGELPANIIVHDFMSGDQLRDLLGKSRFYMQVSMSEGFPNALCEAMLCECIPVGTYVGAIPFIIDDSGIVIGKKDIELAIERISGLIQLPGSEMDNLGKKARKNIVARFPLDNREHSIFKLIAERVPDQV